MTSLSWAQQLPLTSLNSPNSQQALQNILNQKFSVFGGTVTGQCFLSTTTVTEVCFPDGSCFTSAGSGGVGITGSGTTNTISKFTNTSTIGNSGITDDGATIKTGETVNIQSNSLGVLGTNVLIATGTAVSRITSGQPWSMSGVGNEIDSYDLNGSVITKFSHRTWGHDTYGLGTGNVSEDEFNDMVSTGGTRHVMHFNPNGCSVAGQPCTENTWQWPGGNLNIGAYNTVVPGDASSYLTHRVFIHNETQVSTNGVMGFGYATQAVAGHEVAFDIVPPFAIGFGTPANNMNAIRMLFGYLQFAEPYTIGYATETYIGMGAASQNNGHAINSGDMDFNVPSLSTFNFTVNGSTQASISTYGLEVGASVGVGIKGDVTVNRGGASPGTGAIFFGNSAALNYQYFNGNIMQLTMPLQVNANSALTPTQFALDVTSQTVSTHMFAVLGNGHLETTGTTPSVASCGSIPNGSVVGNDNTGIITVGGGVVTACTLNFAFNWTNTPSCNVTDSSASVGAAVTSASISSITVGLSATLGGGTIYYNCRGYR